MASRAAHCRYDEEGCYRENPDHFHEFRHEPERSMHETMARLCDKFVVLGFSPQSVHAVLEHQHGHYESTERLLVEELSRREAQGQHDVLVRGAHSSRTRVDPPANSFIEALPATATGNPEERRLAAHGSTGLTPSTVADPQPCHHQDKGGLACVVSATSGETRTRQATCPGATSAMTPSHAPPAQGPKDSVPPSVVRVPLQLPCPAPGDGPLSPPTVAATAEPNRRTDEQRTMSEKPTGVSSRSPPRYSRECEAGAGAPPEFAIVRATTRALQEAGVGGGAGAAAQPNSAPPPPATVQRPSNSVVRAPRQPQRPAPGDGPSPLTLGGAVTQGHTPPLASLPAAKRVTQPAATAVVPTPVVTPHAIAGARQSLAGSRTPAPTTAAVAVAAAIVCASCDNVIVKDVRHIGLVEEKMFKPDPRPNWRPPIHATTAQRCLRKGSVDPRPHPDRIIQRWKQQRLFCVKCDKHVGLTCRVQHAKRKLHSTSRTVLIKNKHASARFTLADGSSRTCRLPPWREVLEQLVPGHKLVGVTSITVAALATVCRGVSPCQAGVRSTGHGGSAEDTASKGTTGNTTRNKASRNTAVKGKAAQGRAARGKAATLASEMPTAKPPEDDWQTCTGRVVAVFKRGCIVKLDNPAADVKAAPTASVQKRTAFVRKAGLVVYVAR